MAATSTFGRAKVSASVASIESRTCDPKASGPKTRAHDAGEQSYEKQQYVETKDPENAITQSHKDVPCLLGAVDFVISLTDRSLFSLQVIAKFRYVVRKNFLWAVNFCIPFHCGAFNSR